MEWNERMDYDGKFKVRRALVAGNNALFSALERIEMKLLAMPTQYISASRAIVGTRLLYVFRVVTIVTLFARVNVRSVWAQHESGPTESGKSQAVEIIRQGGYVEKVQPGVDYKNRLPRSAPLSPQQSLKAFHLIPGVRIELAAAEPLVRDPVDIAFDENGRMIVAELITYSERRESLEGRIAVLEDTDRDGRYDTSSILVE